jgi:hypothetical protein
MSQTSTNRKDSVELSEKEFEEVYALLKMCLAAEIGVDEKSVTDGDAFIKSCEQILSITAEVEDRKHYDMSHGFVPLFERLHNVRHAPVKTDTGTIYRVDFKE